MVRLFTVTALLLWLARPSCALCCVEGRSPGEHPEAAMVRQLPIPDDCCPGSDAEHGSPSARTCCLLDEHSNDFTHHPTDSHEPSPGGVVERLLLPVDALHNILLTHQPSPDLSSTHLRCSVLLI
jgi:hypothetical protein